MRRKLKKEKNRALAAKKTECPGRVQPMEPCHVSIRQHAGQYVRPYFFPSCVSSFHSCLIKHHHKRVSNQLNYFYSRNNIALLITKSAEYSGIWKTVDK
jgi:hypothetical protein